MKLLGRSQLVAFAAVTIMAVGVGAALANTQHRQPPHDGADHGFKHECSPAQVQRNKATVVAYYTMAFNDKKPEEAVARYGGPVYIQHNPQAADGFDAFIAFVKFYTGQFPQLHVDIKRVIGECDHGRHPQPHHDLADRPRPGGGRHLPPQPPGQGRRALGRHPGRAGDVGEQQHHVLKPDIRDILRNEVAESYDVAIAGGGIGALTAAVHASRMGRSTIVVGGRAPGGLLLSIERIDGVPGFPEGIAGYELCPMLQEQAADDGAEIRMADLEGLERAGEDWRLQTSDGEVQARAVILATGARLRSLAVEGEERLQGRGVSHCASCDAPLMRDRTVGVVGGGDSALQEALTLADAVGEVIVLHRGDELTAQAAYREPVLAHPKITVRYGTVVEEILGEDAVSGVRTHDVASGDTRDLELGGLFIYVGLEPNSDYLRDLVELDDDGRIPTDANMQTELAGVFAAGIVRRGSLGQAAISAGEGAAAAKAAHRHLGGEAAGRASTPAAAAARGNGG